MFVNQQGLSVHIKCKHLANNNTEKTDSSSSTDIVIEESAENTSTSSDSQPSTSSDPQLSLSSSNEAEEKTVNRRGRDRHKSITNIFKTQVIMEVEAGEKQSDVAEKFKIHKSQVSA